MRKLLVPQVYREVMKLHQEMLAALNRMKRSLVRWPHVVGYGLGQKLVRGYPTRSMVPVFFVDEKIARHRLKPAHRLPATLLIQGRRYPTDVVKVHPLRLEGLGDNGPNQLRKRPYPMGSAICVYEPFGTKCKMQGTAGALVVKKKSPGSFWVLSAGHVLLAICNPVVEPWARTNLEKNTPNPHTTHALLAQVQ